MNKVSIVIPVYNEKETLHGILDKVINSDTLHLEKEIIIVDDKSKDGTAELLIDIQKQMPFLKVLYHEKNKGKGGALKTGFGNATGDIILIQDADMEYDPDEYPHLLSPILENKADIVFGSRFMGGRPHRVLYFWHYIANKMLTLFSNMFSNLNLSDMETCYKVFKREYINKMVLKQNRFGIEPELTAKFAKLKVRIYEIGISYFGRTYEEGKKIGLKDAFKAFFCIIKYNLGALKYYTEINGKKKKIKAKNYKDYQKKYQKIEKLNK